MKFVSQSLELHLFFARIMKEHSLFLEAGFPPVNAACGKEAERFKGEFEALLCQAAAMADGLLGEAVLRSGELVTQFTVCAEEQTENLTGIRINRDITAKIARLRPWGNRNRPPEHCPMAHALNRKALCLLDGLISLKERILGQVLSCRMFTMNYPLLLEHIIREAKLYRDAVSTLERTGALDCRTMRQTQQFWNQIMMEHALFIRGLLDPAENHLIATADSFARDYAKLLDASCGAQDRVIAADGGQTLSETKKFRDFKEAGAKGIQECRIRSLILPLLADHVLREANHYIRLLESENGLAKSPGF